MSDGDETRADGEWRASLSAEQYIDHLESLIQLQLETISLRDGHYSSAREQAERAIEYAQSLEQERARFEEAYGALEAERARLEGELARVRAPDSEGP